MTFRWFLNADKCKYGKEKQGVIAHVFLLASWNRTGKGGRDILTTVAKRSSAFTLAPGKVVMAACCVMKEAVLVEVCDLFNTGEVSITELQVDSEVSADRPVQPENTE